MANFRPLPEGGELASPSSNTLQSEVEMEELDVSNLGEGCVNISGVHKTYMLGVEGVAALRGVDMTVAPGEFVAICGTSGGGKTSLLNLIGTIDVPTRGRVGVCGTSITERTTDNELAKLRLHKIGFVFQAFNLLTNLTALENVEIPMRLAGELSAQDRRSRAIELLQKVGLQERANHLPSQLSGGEQQRVTIARSLANQPTLLLLDEPTGDLDSRNSDLVVQLLLELNSEGMAMVMVTHDMALKHFAHRVVNLYDGKVSKIEEVSPDVRRDAIQELALVCEQHLRDDEPNVEAGLSDTTSEIVTEYRTKSDYPACLVSS